MGVFGLPLGCSPVAYLAGAYDRTDTREGDRTGHSSNCFRSKGTLEISSTEPTVSNSGFAVNWVMSGVPLRKCSSARSRPPPGELMNGLLRLQIKRDIWELRSGYNCVARTFVCSSVDPVSCKAHIVMVYRLQLDSVSCPFFDKRGKFPADV